MSSPPEYTRSIGAELLNCGDLFQGQEHCSIHGSALQTSPFLLNVISFALFVHMFVCLSSIRSSSPKMTQQMRDLQSRKQPGPSSPNAAKRLYRNLSGKFRVNYMSFDEGNLAGRSEKEKLRKPYLVSTLFCPVQGNFSVEFFSILWLDTFRWSDMCKRHVCLPIGFLNFVSHLKAAFELCHDSLLPCSYRDHC